MKLRFALLVVGVPLLALGGEGLYHAAHSRRQAAMTCEQFVRQRPAELWVRLTECELGYDSPGYREADGHITEIFFPVRIAGQPGHSPAPLLAATTDPAALAIVQGTIGSGPPADQETVTVMMLRVVTLLRASREIDGLVRAGVVERFQTRRALRSFPVALAPDYVVIDLHTRPAVGWSAVEAGVGLLSVLLFLFAGRVPRRAGDESGAAEAPADLPAMLLLNLARSAGVDAIEGAPPLGARLEVIGKIGRALDGIRLGDDGTGVFTRADHTLAIDLGVHDPVWTATVRASGPGAAHAVSALAEATGWRLYVPKRGRFVVD